MLIYVCICTHTCVQVYILVYLPNVPGNTLIYIAGNMLITYIINILCMYARMYDIDRNWYEFVSKYILILLYVKYIIRTCSNGLLQCRI